MACIAAQVFPISPGAVIVLPAVPVAGLSPAFLSRRLAASISKDRVSSSSHPCGTTAYCRTPVGAARSVPPEHYPLSSTLVAFGRVGPQTTPLSVTGPPCGFPVPSSDPNLAAGGFRVTGSSSYSRWLRLSKGWRRKLSTKTRVYSQVHKTSF